MRRPTNLRLALVIGKAAHAAAPLLNLSNDAKAISAAAHGLHNHRSAQGAGATGTRAGGAALKGRHGVGLLYHAGHGLQLHGRNDSVPVDAQLTSAADVPAQTLPLPPRATKGPMWRLESILGPCRCPAFAEKQTTVVDPAPSLAVRASACKPMPFGGLGACASKAPPHPPPSPARGRGSNARPPLPRAGEGWGEGVRVTPRFRFS